MGGGTFRTRDRGADHKAVQRLVCVYAGPGGAGRFGLPHLGKHEPVSDPYRARLRRRPAGGEYVITAIAPKLCAEAPQGLQVSRDGCVQTLRWDTEEGRRYRVYRAIDDDAAYTLLAGPIDGGVYTDPLDISAVGHAAYKVTACFTDGSGESDGPVTVVNHASRFDLERLAHMQRQLNL